jgi:hypothetical protein
LPAHALSVGVSTLIFNNLRKSFDLLQNYTITLAVQYRGVSLPNTTIELTVIHSDLVVQLAPTGNITQAVDQTLTLNASTSYDPDNIPFNFTWACSNPGSYLSCKDASGNYLVLSDDNGVLEIAANTLVNSTVYQFVVTAQTQDGRTSNAIASVNIH